MNELNEPIASPTRTGPARDASHALSPRAHPHVHGPAQVRTMMLWVMAALLPATLYGFSAYGAPALALFTVTLAAALVSEALGLAIARRPVLRGLGDGSAILTAWILALSLPPWAPLWLGALGGAFAIIVGKQIFGGLGNNLFNPAMLARVMLLVAFPAEMTQWLAPFDHSPCDGGEAAAAWWLQFVGGLGSCPSVQTQLDAVSSASYLGATQLQLSGGQDLALLSHGVTAPSLLQAGPGSLGEAAPGLVLLGGVFLIAVRVIDWHIPAAMLGSLAALSAIGYHVSPEAILGPVPAVLSGSVLLGAFFIATDPVTSPVTRIGRLVFGAGCGVLVFAIRAFGAFPEGVAFAVLLMNACTPLIDHWFRPRIYGRDRRGRALTMPRAIGARDNKD